MMRPTLWRGLSDAYGILEDHLHTPSQRPQLGLIELRDVLAVEVDGSLGRLVEADDRASDGGLAAAGLADEPDGLALLDRQGDVVDRADVSHVPVENEAALDREIDLEMLELDEWAGAVRRVRHAVAASRSRCHSSAGTGLKQATLCPRSTSTSDGTERRDSSTSKRQRG